MADGDDLMQMRPIGYLHSIFHFKNGTPRQPSLCSTARGSLSVEKTIFNNPEHALEGLEQFSHAWIVFVFHKNQPGHTKAKVKPPRLNGKRVGVFSTRSPYRPNAIGLTLAKIERIAGATIHFSGIDIIDGTPVLDIKPFIPQYDIPEGRGELFTQDLCAGSDENQPLNSGMDPEDSFTVGIDSVSTDLESTRSTNLQLCMSGSQGSSAGDSFKKEGQRIRAAELEKGSSVTAASDHGDDTVKKTEETRQNCEHIETSSTQSPELSLSPKDGCVSRESSGANGFDTMLVSSDYSHPQNCEQQRKLQYWTNDDRSDKEAENSQGISVEAFTTTEQEQPMSASSSQPPARNGEFSSLNTSVAQWLSSPPVSKLVVSFTPVAEAQLQKFKSSSDTDNEYSLKFLCGAEDIRTAIVSVLTEDPRSVYRREKCRDSLYFFTVDQVHVTCWFDDKENRAEVVRLQPVSCVEKLQVRET